MAGKDSLRSTIPALQTLFTPSSPLPRTPSPFCLNEAAPPLCPLIGSQTNSTKKAEDAFFCLRDLRKNRFVHLVRYKK